MVLNQFDNLTELLEKDQGAELRRVIKKDPNDSQSEYESASDADKTPQKEGDDKAGIVIVPPSSEANEMGPPESKPRKKKRKRSSSGTTPKSKRRKSTQSPA